MQTIPVLDKDNNIVAIINIENKITVNLIDNSKKHSVEKLIKNVYGVNLKWEGNYGKQRD